MPTLTLPAAPVKADRMANFAAGLYPNRYGLRAPAGGCTVAGKLYRGGQFCLPYDVANPHGVGAGPVRLTLNGFTYTVEGLHIPAEMGTGLFLIRKAETNNSYAVCRDNDGVVSCDCGDYEFRHRGNGTTCKHGRALIAAGLIPLPSSAPLQPSRRIDPPAVVPPGPRRRRFEPTPEDMALAAAMFNA